LDWPGKRPVRNTSSPCRRSTKPVAVNQKRNILRRLALARAQAFSIVTGEESTRLV
jgi:hypothetical protein